jgi:signal transduction histidine kinase
LIALVITTVMFTVGAYSPSGALQSYVPLTSVSAVAMLVLFGGLMKRLNGWLDRLLFKRPDYERVLSTIVAGMPRCSDRHGLADFVTTQLRDALGASFVRYEKRSVETDEMVVAVGPLERPRGTLTFGPRPRQQPYGSDDLLFIHAVVAQFAAQLEAFDAQDSAQLATNAELKALRAQINPHFLFNALNTLAEMTRGRAAAERAILNLARVFRYALDSTRHETVPLQDEVDAVRAYLEIEQERFEELLKFEIDVPESLTTIHVPPMLLQPLVENAVKHGLSNKVQGGTVRIAAARENGHLRLSVQDDGVGFDPDRTSRSIGLTTVGTRVERTGGSCRVQSIPGAGTLVTLAVALQ